METISKARDLDEKAERRRAILRAAGSVLAGGPSPDRDRDRSRSRDQDHDHEHDPAHNPTLSTRLPSVSEIARAAGLAKGTIYLYFSTKEEIYLALLGEWLSLVVEVLRPAVEAESPSIEGLVRRYVRFCARNPMFMRLASMSASILEQNIDEDTAHAFKRTLAVQVGGLTRRLSDATGADEAQLRKLFIHMFSLSTGLWQHCHPPAVVGRAYARGDAQLIEMDFETDLTEALLAMFGGMMR